MITANSIRNLIKEIDPEIDNIISRVIQPKLLKGCRFISVDGCEVLTQDDGSWNSKFITKNKFIEQMVMRGFYIKPEYTLNAELYFVIGIPPQEE